MIKYESINYLDSRKVRDFVFDSKVVEMDCFGFFKASQ